LLILAWRGKRVGDAPHCRKCGFDLSGKRESETRCPECGRDVSQASAVRAGARHKRPFALWAGVILILCGVGGLSLSVIGTTRALPLNQRPNSVLIAQVLLGDESAELATELESRYTLGKLSNAELSRIAGPIVGMFASADPDVFDQSAWRTLLDDAVLAGLLTDAQHQRYTRAVLESCWFEGRLREWYVRTDRPIWRYGPIAFFDRRPSADEPILAINYPVRIVMNGEPQPITPRTRRNGDADIGYSYREWRPNGSSASASLTPSRGIDAGTWQIGPLPPGRYNFEVEYQYEFYLDGPKPNQQSNVLTRQELGEPDAVTRTVYRSFVIIYEDPAEALPLVDSSWDLPVPVIELASVSVSPHDETWYQLDTPMQRAPADGDRALVCADLSAELNGRLVSLYWWPMTIQRNLHASSFWPNDPNEYDHANAIRHGNNKFYIRKAQLPRSESIDLVLAPNLEEAANLNRFDVLWNEPILLKDVPLDWSAVDEAEAGSAAPGGPP